MTVKSLVKALPQKAATPLTEHLRRIRDELGKDLVERAVGMGLALLAAPRAAGAVSDGNIVRSRSSVVGRVARSRFSERFGAWWRLNAPARVQFHRALLKQVQSNALNP